MGAVRRFAVADLDRAARRLSRRRGLAVGALDETGQEKKGQATAGRRRNGTLTEVEGRGRLGLQSWLSW